MKAPIDYVSKGKKAIIQIVLYFGGSNISLYLLGHWDQNIYGMTSLYFSRSRIKTILLTKLGIVKSKVMANIARRF